MSATAWIAASVAGCGWLAAMAVARYWWAQTRRDGLTGLGNRAYLVALATRAARSGHPVGVALVDVDHFKAINDTYGHRVGDRVLCEIAARLEGATRLGERVVRLHGDEFAVWLGTTDPRSARRRAAELADTLTDPIQVDGHQVAVSISVGAATGALTTGGLGEVLERADMAMYEAKRTRPHPDGEPLSTPPRLRDLTAQPVHHVPTQRFSVLGGER